MSELLNKLEPLGIYNPRGVKHSIIEVVLQVNFDKPIPDITKWKDKIKSSYLEKRFDHQEDCEEIVFALGKNDDLSAEPKERRRNIGFIFDDRTSEKQAPKSVLIAHNYGDQSLNGSLLRLHCLRYIDSSTFFDDIRAVLESFSAIWSDLNINSFYLTYIDRFHYSDKQAPDLSSFFSDQAFQIWNTLVGQGNVGAFNSHTHSDNENVITFKTITHHYTQNKKGFIIEIRHASQVYFSKKSDERMTLEQWLGSDRFFDDLGKAKKLNQDFLKKTLSQPVLEKIGLV